MLSPAIVPTRWMPFDVQSHWTNATARNRPQLRLLNSNTITAFVLAVWAIAPVGWWRNRG
ncbi:hypothetical protein [Novipirellula rosea]|uniref:hypothetical protein n=1 Tax=Novipirellula rosea TaxID=1031540 RepID=UPI0031E66587